jgi:hypothetical protein
MAKVGIKLADGKFYPILDGNSSSGKKLVLTTVCDGQSSAQIDFYWNDEVMADQMRYIGTLVIEDLSQKYAGETSIELRVRSTGDGRVLAEAFEVDGTGGSQKLEVDVKGHDIKDSDDDVLDDELSSGVKVVAKRRLNPITPVIVAAIIFLIAAIVFLFLFLLPGCPSQPNVYTQPPAREEPVISPPPVLDESANMPEIPLPDPSQYDSRNDNRDGEPPRETTVTETPDLSRKALRTETAR